MFTPALTVGLTLGSVLSCLSAHPPSESGADTPQTTLRWLACQPCPPHSPFIFHALYLLSVPPAFTGIRIMGTGRVRLWLLLAPRGTPPVVSLGQEIGLIVQTLPPKLRRRGGDTDSEKQSSNGVMTLMRFKPFRDMVILYGSECPAPLPYFCG